MNDVYQSLAKQVLDLIGHVPETTLIYAEVEDGVTSVDIFYVDDGNPVVEFRFAP